MRFQRLRSQLAERLADLDERVPGGVTTALHRAIRNEEAERARRRGRLGKAALAAAATVAGIAALGRTRAFRRRYAEAVRRAGHTRWFAEAGRRIAPPIDRTLHRLSGGRLHAAEEVLPTLILVHTGRKTGQEHRAPLAYVRRDDAYALMASNWGQAHHPSWSENLLAHPEALVEVSGEVIPVRARLVTEAEREELWPRFVAMWPAYETYQERAGGRDLRVFLCEPR